MVVARLQENWQALRTELFPAKVLLELNDQLLAVQRFPGRRETLAEPVVVPIPAATCRQGRPLQGEALGDFIGDLLLGHGQITAHLSVALPAAATHWRVLAGLGPTWPADPVASVRALHPDLGLPFPLDGAYLDLMPLRAPEPLALALAIERSLMAAWLEVFAIAGVRLDRIVPAQVALMAALQERLAAADPDALVVLLLPEPKALRLLVWREGVPIYERQLVGAPAQQVASLERALTFLHGQQGLAPTTASQILLDAAVDAKARASLEELLALDLELADSAGYGSLVLLGLARLEASA